MQEDVNAPWYLSLRQYNLGSTLPVLRLMIQQSNCFVIVERGGGLNDMMRERQLMRGEEGRAGSNMGGGQMVAADYLMRPSIQFSGKTGGGGRDDESDVEEHEEEITYSHFFASNNYRW